jgi:hypothetical protein
MAKEYPIFAESEDLSRCLQNPVWAGSMQSTTSHPISVRSIFYLNFLTHTLKLTVEIQLIRDTCTTRARRSRGVSSVARKFVQEGGGRQIQLRTEGRESGDLGVVDP